MGILGLETYIERNLPNAYCYEVDIKELADIYRRDTGRRPVIVVDGPNYLRMLADDMEDQYWILGGQLKEFVETSKHFVACFKEWNEILKMAKIKHESCNVTAHMYPIMLGHVYELSVAIENYNNRNLVSTAEAFLPLRQRIYGVLLYENPDTAHVNELCIQSNECPGEATQIPIKLITHIEKFHPGLCKLWSDECHEDLRWHLFVESLTEKNKLSADSIKKLGFPYVVPVAVLYYLLQERKDMLKEEEIDVILLQAASVKVYTADDIKAMRNQLHSGNVIVRRVAEIATVFTRGVTMVLFLLSACGFPLHEDVCSTYRKMRELVMPIKSWRS
ncbi:hypothetical protein L9F63_002872 [Diploptera punctata]|uniref:Uncharacterized protein n=1 Tax=Diploptera punctata TaxID=6984 RepID=A0AAD7ZRH9_DIPPU|nr:hypothetical protein L9F63_002872 [Diploptera punctata]